MWGEKRRVKQYVVGAPMERIATDILDSRPTARNLKKEQVYTGGQWFFFTKWTENYQ